MKSSMARRLLRINRDFYESFAAPFARSRSSFQPGVLRALEALGPRSSLLDVGCGDGRVGHHLSAGPWKSTLRRYRGVDLSPALLAASQLRGPLPSTCRLIEADITDSSWNAHPDLALDFEAAVCFSVLFHIPGPRRRLRLLREIRERLVPGGTLALSVWQFLHVPRLRAKVVPWSEVGLRDDQLDPGDLLLDWWRGGRGLRYVHHFEPTELATLCDRAGFAVEEEYVSDGRSGDLGRFFVLRKE